MVSPDLTTALSKEENKISEITVSDDTSPSASMMENPKSIETLDTTTELVIPTVKGDNREVSIQTDFPPEFQSLLVKDSPIMVMFEELKAIRARLDTVDKIETTTSSLADLLKSNEERTNKLEGLVKSNSTSIKDLKSDVKSIKIEFKKSISSNTSQIKDVNTELASLRKTVELQGRALAKLTTLKSDVLKQNKEVKEDLVKQNQVTRDDLIKKNEGITVQMNKLLEQQKDQVHSFQNTTQRVEKNILQKTEERIEEKVEKVSQDFSFQQLRNQAFDNRHNIIITGLEEESGKNIRTVVTEFFKTLGEEKIAILDAYRLGPERNDPSYHRPIKVRFTHLVERNRIWRKRRNLSAEDGSRKAKIQADLPKELRDETGILYRITRAAAKLERFKTSVSISNYAILFNGKEFTTRELEKLPTPIRPTSISNQRSEEAIVFFSKYSALSNHHPSPFTLHGQAFQHMEQYLASRKAQFSGREDLIQRSAQATDPKVAKAILHSLREDHKTEWDQQVEKITIEGLRAKFSQNEHLLHFLKGTENLQIGEASTNPRWGIGLELDNSDVLDLSKWNPTGNLLGRSLMKIRSELCPTVERKKSKSSQNRK